MKNVERWVRVLPFLCMALFFVGCAVEQFLRGETRATLGSLTCMLSSMVAVWHDLKTDDRRLPAWVYLLGGLVTAVIGYTYPVHELWKFVFMASFIVTALMASIVIYHNASRHKE